MWQYVHTNELYHHGIKGMRWGVRRFQNENGSLTPAGKIRVQQNNSLNSIKEKAINKAYGVGVQMNPREYQYSIKRTINRPSPYEKLLSETTLEKMKNNNVLPSDLKTMNAIEKVGIEKHKQAKYELNDEDLGRLKTYTNSARYSRNVNSYLATWEPKEYAEKAKELKDTLSKTRVSDTTVFRSCSLQFSFNGVAKKLDSMSEEELAKSFDSFSRNYKGKSFKENRVFSTSTSPNFAIDTWRRVNPTAAKTYNTYMVLYTENCPGLLADGRTTRGQKLVNTRSNQECILAPSRIRYDGLAYDKERNMFVITATALGEVKK